MTNWRCFMHSAPLTPTRTNDQLPNYHILGLYSPTDHLSDWPKKPNNLVGVIFKQSQTNLCLCGHGTAMAWKSIPTVCSQMCSRKGRAGENLAARPSFAATRRSLLLLRAEILIREENYGARSEGFDLDNFQRELELFCMESHAGQPCADLIK